MLMKINQGPDQPFYQSSNDEIDLLELCATLWRRKWIIIAIIGFSTVITVIWLIQQPSFYRLEVQFDQTSDYDIQPLQPTHLGEGSPYKLNKLKSEDFYDAFLTQVGSLNTKKMFWEQWSQQPLSFDDSKEPTGNDRAFKKFFEQLTLTPPNLKSPNVTLSKLTLETPKPTEDAKALTKYVDFANNLAVEKFVGQLDNAYKAKLEQLEFDYNTLLKREKQKIQDTLLQLNEGLEIARSLKIVETPYEQLTGVELKVVDDRQYMLGTRVLLEEIKSLEARASKPLSAFVPELRQMEYSREIIENDLRKLHASKDDVRAYYLASSVVSSLEPVKPKKIIVLLGAIFVSAIIGIIVAFILEAVKSYQARSARVSEV